MKRIWILEELTDTPYPHSGFLTPEARLEVKFSCPDDLHRMFRILSVIPKIPSITPDPIPEMGFDEWW